MITPICHPYAASEVPPEVHLQVARHLNYWGAYFEAYRAASAGLESGTSSATLRAELYLNSAVALLHLGDPHEAYGCALAGLDAADPNNRDLRAALYIKAAESHLLIHDFPAAARSARAAADEASTDPSVVELLSIVIRKLREVWSPKEGAEGSR